ncbi:unnamed protein product, partial [Callosobruchus maculatus]
MQPTVGNYEDINYHSPYR